MKYGESKVLVTGANGFVGINLVKTLLDAGHEVRCLVRRNSNCQYLAPLNVEYAYGDVTDRESLRQAVRGVSRVFNLAGKTRARNKREFLSVNGSGTANLVDACCRAETPPSLIHISSLAAAGPPPKGECQVESRIPRPCSHYGISKLVGEKSIIERSSELEATIIRPPFIFGEYDFYAFELFKMVRRTGLHLIPGLFDKPFSFIYGNDLCRVIVAVADRGERLTPNSLTPISSGASNASNETAKACSGEGIYFTAGYELPSYKIFGKMLAQAVKRKRFFPIRCGAAMVMSVALGGEVMKRFSKKFVGIDLDKAREALSGPWVCSNKKVENDFSIVPEKSFQERLDQTAQWYFDQKLLK